MRPHALFSSPRRRAPVRRPRFLTLGHLVTQPAPMLLALVLLCLCLPMAISAPIRSLDDAGASLERTPIDADRLPHSLSLLPAEYPGFGASPPDQSLVPQYTFTPPSMVLLVRQDGLLLAYHAHYGTRLWSVDTGGPVTQVRFTTTPSSATTRTDPLATPLLLRDDELWMRVPGERAEPGEPTWVPFMKLSTLLRRRHVSVDDTDVYVSTTVAITDVDAMSGRVLRRAGESTVSSVLPRLHLVRYNMVIHAIRPGAYDWSLHLSQIRASSRSGAGSASVNMAVSPVWRSRPAAPVRSASGAAKTASGDEQRPRFMSSFLARMFSFDTREAAETRAVTCHDRVNSSSAPAGWRNETESATDSDTSAAMVCLRGAPSSPLYDHVRRIRSGADLHDERVLRAHFTARFALYTCNETTVILRDLVTQRDVWQASTHTDDAAAVDQAAANDAAAERVVFAYTWMSELPIVMRIPVWRPRESTPPDGVMYSVHVPPLSPCPLTYGNHARADDASVSLDSLPLTRVAGANREDEDEEGTRSVRREAAAHWSAWQPALSPDEDRVAHLMLPHYRMEMADFTVDGAAAALEDEEEARCYVTRRDDKTVSPASSSCAAYGSSSSSAADTAAASSSLPSSASVWRRGGGRRRAAAWRQWLPASHTAAVSLLHLTLLACSMGCICAGAPSRGRLQRAWDDADHHRHRHHRHRAAWARMRRGGRADSAASHRTRLSCAGEKKDRVEYNDDDAKEDGKESDEWGAEHVSLERAATPTEVERTLSEYADKEGDVDAEEATEEQPRDRSASMSRWWSATVRSTSESCEAPTATRGGSEVRSATATPSPSSVSTGLFEQHFKILCKIGSGGAGSVFCVEHRVTRARYAIKVVHLRAAAEGERELREAVLHSSFDNPHVVRFYFCWIENVPWAVVAARQLMDRVDEDTEDGGTRASGWTEDWDRSAASEDGGGVRAVRRCYCRRRPRRRSEAAWAP